MRQIVLIGMFIMASTSPAYAVVSFGTAVNTGTAGVSIQARPTPSTGIHGTYLFLGRRPAATLDYQVFSDRLAQTNTKAYAGVGAAAAVSTEEKHSEVYALRIPGGVQYDFQFTPTQAFAEVAGVFGPLPRTDSKTQFSLGLRAWF